MKNLDIFAKKFYPFFDFKKCWFPGNFQHNNLNRLEQTMRRCLPKGLKTTSQRGFALAPEAVSFEEQPMDTPDFKRKLSAIFSADAVGYSRLMRQDEPATVQTLTAYREMISTLIKQHHGRVVDSPGDNVLAEFASVVDAVQSAVAIQRELRLRNAQLASDRRMEFRIGINLGDVIADGDRIYGDGVNIAARLEGIAEPGGICISRTAYDQIEDKLPFGYEYLGQKEVKNIPKPVHAYKVLLEPDDAKPSFEEPASDTKAQPQQERAVPDVELEDRLGQRNKEAFKRHLRTYVGVIGFLFIVNLLTGGSYWFYWPALAWGLGLFLHWSHGHARHRPRRRPFSDIPIRRESKWDKRLKYLRIQVDPKGDEDGQQGRVNIRIPLNLLRAGAKLTSVLPGHAREKINEALRGKGLEFDIASLEGEKLEDLLRSLSDMDIEVVEKNKTVRIYIE
jgi:class 3 adenylate cyclase